MAAQDWILVLLAALFSAVLLWFFFGPEKPWRAELGGGMQTITVTAKGGYNPDLTQVARGVPARPVFDRQETGDCSFRVIVPGFRINQSLSAAGYRHRYRRGFAREQIC